MRGDPIVGTMLAAECSTTGSGQGGQSWVLIISATNSPRHDKVMIQVQGLSKESNSVQQEMARDRAWRHSYNIGQGLSWA